MKKIRNVLCLLLILAIPFSLVVGCSKKNGAGADTDKQVTLKWAFPLAEQKDYALVMEEINKQLETLLPNTKLELVLDPSMADKWALWMSGGTEIDIAQMGFVNDLLSEISNDAFMPLNDYVDKYAPAVKEEMSFYKNDYQTGTYNTTLYGIPNIQYHIRESKRLHVPEDLMEYLDLKRLTDVTFSSPTTTEEFYIIIDEFLTKAYASGKVNSETIANVIDIKRMASEIPTRGYEFIGGSITRFVGGASSSLCYKAHSDKAEIIDFHTTDEFKTFMKYAGKWFKQGYISKDVLTGGSAGNRQYILSATISSRATVEADYTYKELDTSIFEEGVYRRFICIDNPENDYAGISNIGSLQTYTVIPYTSKNPERAMMLIDLLRTEKGIPLMNLLCYGLEGKHYERTADRAIHPLEYQYQGSATHSYGLPNWMVGNMFFADVCTPYYSQKVVDYGRKFFEEKRPALKKTPLYGLAFNLDPIVSEMSQLFSINREYDVQLISGVLANYEETYKNLLDLSKTAGMEKVIKELQKQADDFTKK